MPVFIAPGADFSANNLGQISLDYSEKTKAVLAAYSNYDLTESEKDALDLFIRSLTDNGIFSKIDKLYMPILSNDLAKSMINVAALNLAVDVTPNSSSYQLHSSGGLLSLNDTNPLNISYDGTSRGTTNFHFLGFNTADIDSQYAFVGAINVANPALLYMNFFGVVTGNPLRISPSTQLAGQNIANVLASPRPDLFRDIMLKGVSFDNTANIKVLRRNQVMTVNYSSAVTSSSIGSVVTVNLAGFENRSIKAPMGLISIGSALTESELSTFNNAARSLMSAFGITAYS